MAINGGPFVRHFVINGASHAVAITIQQEYGRLESGMETVTLTLEGNGEQLEPALSAWMRQFRFVRASATSRYRYDLGWTSVLEYVRSIASQDAQDFWRIEWK